jgi:hypothetical protein
LPPGSAAPRIAQFAKDFKLHYTNLTEYVAETEEIIALSKNGYWFSIANWLSFRIY